MARHADLVPNRGAARQARRSPQGRATFQFAGRLRFVDRGRRRAALRVDGGNGMGRRFLGRTVTIDLEHARVAAVDRDASVDVADLTAGDRVTVLARLPRRLTAPPPLVPVRRLAVADLSGDRQRIS